MTVKTLEDTKKHLVKDDKLKVNKAVFVVSNINGSDATYSYKSEGSNAGGWFASTEIKYDDGEVDAFTASGSNFGYLGWGNHRVGLTLSLPRRMGLSRTTPLGHGTRVPSFGWSTR